VLAARPPMDVDRRLARNAREGKVPAMSHPTVLVVGLGFMGGSLAAALTEAGWPVLLHHRRPEVAQRAEELGYGRHAPDPAQAMARAQLAVVCTPVSTIVPQVRELAAMAGDAVISDVGSVKGPLCGELGELGRAGRFLGSHPMAGSHLQGLAHARADLFRGCTTAITPVPGTPLRALDHVELLWHAVGSRTHRMAPDEHDRAVAEASHLPHVAAALVAAGLGDQAVALAASGFRDTTRVAAGDPALWADILLSNRGALSGCLQTASHRLRELLGLLESGDQAAVAAWLAEGCDGRRRFERVHHPPAALYGDE
jgi:prephenate dehydrogenase